MSLLRVASRAAARSSRTAQPLRGALRAQRRYASSGTDAKKSELPWLIGAIAVTIPSVWFISQPGAPGSGRGGHGAESHGSGAEIEVEGHPPPQDAVEEADAKGSAAPEGEGEDAPHKKEGEDSNDAAAREQHEKGEEHPSNKPPPEAKSDEPANAGDDAEDVEKDMGATQDGTPRKSDKKARPSGEDSGSDDRAASPEGINFKGGSKKREQDAKGGTKVRIDSDLGQNIGEGASSNTGDAMSHKQRGYSATDTRHSVDVSADPEMSKKGEGTVDTAKITGTVDPNRPQV